jgi:hypothetical protein
MEYVIPAVLVLLLVAGFVTFLVLNATRRSGPVAAGGEERPPGIGQDATPLGDTSEHAGEQTEAGTTAQDPEQGRLERDDPTRAAHVARPGEGEGHERLEFEDERPGPEDERPQSERLANRDH